MEGRRKTLMENIFPFDDISTDALKEKQGHAILFELHHWWGRMPLIIARAAVLGSSLPEDFRISEFEELLGFKDHYGLEEYHKKRLHNYNMYLLQTKRLERIFEKFWETKRPTILDPFAGGGSIPFESLRMGFNVVSSDYNPLACLIQRATMEYPAIYGDKLLKDVQEALEWLHDQAEELLKGFYPTNNGKEVANYIYAWVVTCPECQFENPLVTQWWLVKKGKKRVYLEPDVQGEELKLSLKTEGQPPLGNVSHGKAKCLKCGNDIPQDYIQEQIRKYEKEMLLATVLLGEEGKEYSLPTPEDLAALNEIKDALDEREDSTFQKGPLPQDEIPDYLSGANGAKPYLENWHRIFNPRQKILTSSLTRLIKQYQVQVARKEGEDYSAAITTYLAFLLGKHLNRNCRATRYDRKRESVVGTTSLRGIPLLWDHNETNPFTESSGSLNVINQGILKALEYSVLKLQKKDMHIPDLEIRNQPISASEFDASIIVTDPPYVDDAQYSELSDFFYVFERLALNAVLDLPEVTPKSEDLSLSNQRTKKQFEEGYNEAWGKMHSQLSDDGILVVYHAHSSIESWDFLISSLINNNFRITATWPLHLDAPKNPVSRSNASLGSHLLVAARKNLDEKECISLDEAIDLLKSPLSSRLKDFWDYGMRGTDFTVSALGAGLEVLTQYSVDNDTGKMLRFPDFLKLVQRQVIDYILKRFLDYPMDLDLLTLFYLYCRLVGLDGMSMETAHLISSTLATDLEFLESSGIIEIIPKGVQKGVKLLKFTERQNLEAKSLINVIQTSIAIYSQDGIHGFELVLDESGYKRSDLFNILSAFTYFEVGDMERLKALEILRKSSDTVPRENGQTTLF